MADYRMVDDDDALAGGGGGGLRSTTFSWRVVKLVPSSPSSPDTLAISSSMGSGIGGGVLAVLGGVLVLLAPMFFLSIISMVIAIIHAQEVAA